MRLRRFALVMAFSFVHLVQHQARPADAPAGTTRTVSRVTFVSAALNARATSHGAERRTKLRDCGSKYAAGLLAMLLEPVGLVVGEVVVRILEPGQLNPSRVIDEQVPDLGHLRQRRLRRPARQPAAEVEVDLVRQVVEE